MEGIIFSGEDLVEGPVVGMKEWFGPEDQVGMLGRSNEWRRKDPVEKGQDCEAEGRGRQAGTWSQTW